MSNQENNAAQNSVLNTIHKVEGFDPAAYAVPYTDLNTGETRKRLPVMAQMAWFRLVYGTAIGRQSQFPGRNYCSRSPLTARSRIWIPATRPIRHS